jgi:hypothetical protein
VRARPLAAAWLLRRILPASLLPGLAIALSAPGQALALFSATPAAPSAAVTAATISSPTGFSATATGTTTASLSWTAPATLTGYTLSQSPGTLAGCSATPSSSTTSCTATGLSAGTAYTWTLKAVYNNWASQAVQGSATTAAVTSVSLLGSVNSLNGSNQSVTVNSVTTTSGADLLILVYRQQNSALSITSVSGTAISGTPASVNSQAFTSGSHSYEVWAYRATGSGTSGGTVTVTFNATSSASTSIDVVQLSGDKAGSPVAQSAVSTGTSGTATGGPLTGAGAADGEIFFVGVTNSTTMTTSSGYSSVDAPANGASSTHGLWFDSSASATGIGTTLGTSTVYGTIEIEINHG